ncbi:hypothetical protein EZV62_017048 [Acer yangbiense]|uniref:SOSEKI DIX-like domain-containing protein n=1 Tax=Acer yangbiense TaxID=1000413 RepID=A0A5C7HGC3_9ROSI|nr:hypothetical protein EZV62_017048 [Acer yangbiense]
MEGVVKVNGGVGEVRRVHIIYLLSRMGRIEHPHLLRVHHLTRNGVYLRDVKRWLAEVRGQDFPEAFSWSYKRRYKNGYLWQDLLDDDLITPISDNEYVLKGSQYHNPVGSYNGGINHHEKKTCVLRNDVEEQPSQSQMESEILALKLNTSSEIGQDSPLFNGSDTSKQTTSQQNEYNHSSSSFYSNLSNNKTKDGNQQDNNKNDMEKTATSSSSSYISPNSSQSMTKTTYSNGPSSKPKMFRNWITCGGVDTKDAVLVTVNRADKTTPTSTDKLDCRAVINRDGDKLGGSCRVFGSPWNNQHHQQHRARRSFDGSRSSSKKKQYEFGSPKPASDVYKPVGGPTCSQCGKSFKPEKLHAHMKSCKGMKALTRSASLSLRKTPSQRSCNSTHEESISAYFLTN